MMEDIRKIMKKCENCIHFREYFTIADVKYVICKLTNILLRDVQEVNCPVFNRDLSEEDICYNCKHFLGGSDWGLACSKYYHRLPEALNKMCEDGEFK